MNEPEELRSRLTSEIDARIRVEKLHPILLVDDIEINQQLARDILEVAGYKVDTADNGVQAIKMFEEHEYCLILMDIQMPIMDGLCATQQIRCMGEKGRLIPIVALSSLDTQQDIENSLVAGMNAHLIKPVDAQILLSTIAIQLDTNITHSIKPARIHDSDVPFLSGIDIQQSLVRTNNNWPLLKKVMLIFLEKTQASLAELYDAMQIGDIHKAKQLTHAIKGSSATIGANTLSSAATKINLALKESNIDLARYLLPELTLYFSEIEESLSKLKPTTATLNISTQNTYTKPINDIKTVLELLTNIKNNIFLDISKTEPDLITLKAQLEHTRHAATINNVMIELSNFNLLRISELINLLDIEIKKEIVNE